MFHEIYIDESSQNGHQYMVLGGVVIEEPNRDVMVSAMTQTRHALGLDRELKWGKVSNSKLDAYKVYLDKFFEFHDHDLITFHSVVIDCSRLNHARYNRNDSEVGFSKFIYQILIKMALRCRTYQTVHAYLDSRTTRQSLEELRNILNNGLARRHRVTHRPFKRVQFRDSKESEFIQISDLLIGAISYQFNGHHLKQDASRARIALAEHIRNKGGLRTLSAGTPYHQNKFTIWKMALQPR